MQIKSKLKILSKAPSLLAEMMAEIPEKLHKQRRISGKWSIHNNEEYPVNGVFMSMPVICQKPKKCCFNVLNDSKGKKILFLRLIFQEPLYRMTYY